MACGDVGGTGAGTGNTMICGWTCRVAVIEPAMAAVCADISARFARASGSVIRHPTGLLRVGLSRLTV